MCARMCHTFHQCVKLTSGVYNWTGWCPWKYATTIHEQSWTHIWMYSSDILGIFHPPFMRFVCSTHPRQEAIQCVLDANSSFYLANINDFDILLVSCVESISAVSHWWNGDGVMSLQAVPCGRNHRNAIWSKVKLKSAFSALCPWLLLAKLHQFHKVKAYGSQKKCV